MDQMITIPTPPGYVQGQITIALALTFEGRVTFLGFSSDDSEMHFLCSNEDLPRLAEILDLDLSNAADQIGGK